MSASTIEWTEETWNPVTGCSKVSPGCAHCYAETFAERWRGIPGHPYEQGFDLRFWPERLGYPLKWKRPRLIFVNSMSDLFHEQVPFEYAMRVFDVMEQAHWHTFQVLTKRPERMREFQQWRRDQMGSWGDGDVEPNVWLGTSIENRRFVGRADELRATPAAVRFISAEPLLGPLVPEATTYSSIDLDQPDWDDGYDGACLDLAGIDWLIVGGESGPGHRRIDPRWVRDLRDACQGAHPYDHDAWEFVQWQRNGTAFFLKQWGGHRPKSNGRELDGRTWDEMPRGGASKLAVPRGQQVIAGERA